MVMEMPLSGSVMHDADSVQIRYQGYWREIQQFLRPSDISVTWLLFAVKDGSFSYTIGESEGVAEAGDLVLCPPYKEMKRRIETPLTYFYARLTIQEDHFDSLGQAVEVLRSRFSYKFTSNEPERFFHNLRQLARFDLKNDPESIRWRRHFVTDLWLMFYLEAKHYAQKDQLINDPLMKKAKEMIERHAHENIRLQDIASMLDLQPVPFTRRFQKVFGVTPSHYLSGIRMEKAKAMLIETDETIDSIARECGYENGFYFSRMFTKYTKMNPSQFRKIHMEHSP
jgi:AraC-like DNA-binding protein